MQCPLFSTENERENFRKQKFTDEFEAVGGLFTDNVLNIVEIRDMSFRALAQTDEDFESWVKISRRTKSQLTTHEI